MKINTGFCKTSIFYKQFTRKRHVCGVIVRLSAGTARELPRALLSARDRNAPQVRCGGGMVFCAAEPLFADLCRCARYCKAFIIRSLTLKHFFLLLDDCMASAAISPALIPNKKLFICSSRTENAFGGAIPLFIITMCKRRAFMPRAFTACRAKRGGGVNKIRPRRIKFHCIFSAMVLQYEYGQRKIIRGAGKARL